MAKHRFPSGARILVDGVDEAIVKAAWPEGSWHYPWPHYKVDFIDGDRNVAVPWNSVGVEYRKARKNPPRKHNQRGYKWYVVFCKKRPKVWDIENTPLRIESGWEHEFDAYEQLDELPPVDTKAVLHGWSLKRMGRDPNDNKSWASPL